MALKIPEELDAKEQKEFGGTTKTPKDEIIEMLDWFVGLERFTEVNCAKKHYYGMEMQS
jgi:hypothetical protein